MYLGGGGGGVENNKKDIRGDNKRVIRLVQGAGIVCRYKR